ncbi:MAG: helix-turn-helix transcriptional regulator [Nitratireductor sp.]|nr:helix-turn-helix transcriptional regulator [Nitratireductor sp.]
MTPFGLRLRELRAERGITQKEMAAGLGISAAYLSALENGRRGAPSWQFVQKVITFFNIIWDDAEELQALARTSHPRAIVDTVGLSPEATELANLLASHIGDLTRADIDEISHDLRVRLNRRK